MLRDDELRHLRSGVSTGDAPGGAGLSVVTVRAVDVRDLLRRVREVLVVVVEGGPPWAADTRRTLPGWFVAACAPPRSEAEDQRWLSRWRGLDVAGRAAAERERGWTLEEWLGWFEPGERRWWWWSSEVVHDHHLRIAVEVDGWPTPLGALTWLLGAAGATSVETDA